MRTLPEHAAHCVSKGGLDQLTWVMALELDPQGIRIKAVNPTVVMTPLGKGAWNDPMIGDPMKVRIPLGHFAQPEDMSNAVVFLLSEQAAMMNGTVLPIDGGFLTT